MKDGIPSYDQLQAALSLPQSSRRAWAMEMCMQEAGCHPGTGGRNSLETKIISGKA